MCLQKGTYPKTPLLGPHPNSDLTLILNLFLVFNLFSFLRKEKIYKKNIYKKNNKKII